MQLDSVRLPSAVVSQHIHEHIHAHTYAGPRQAWSLPRLKKGSRGNFSFRFTCYLLGSGSCLTRTVLHAHTTLTHVQTHIPGEARRALAGTPWW